MELQID